ncbi:MAG: Mur ligase family protein [Acidimicrobiia bacterium]
MEQPSIITTREQAEAFLDARIGAGVRPGLERISGLLELMGNPHKAYPSIHIAGTNGKTTVARMVQQILGAHGLATGGFTSPHLGSVEERFAIHGETVEPEEFTKAVADIAWFVERYETDTDTTVTYFEVTVALAFSMFAARAVDAAVVEVGLGGRLDATNVVDADVSIVTGVDIDHTEYLGSTVVDIATEKMAILKQGGTLVTGPLPADAIGVAASRVEAARANWIRHGFDFSVTDATLAVGGWRCSVAGVHGDYDGLYLPLHGRHQVEHLALSVASCEMLLGRELDHDALVLAVESVTSPGRLEVVRRRPVVLLDGAHNAQGFRGLAATIDDEFPAMEWRMVLGIRGERSVESLIAPLVGQVCKVYATAANDESAIAPDVIAAAAADVLEVPAAAYERSEQALADAVADAGVDGGVIVTGSLYLVGEVRHLFEVAVDASAGAHLRFEPEVLDD